MTEPSTDRGDLIESLIPVARRWVSAVHREDAASLQRIAASLPGQDWVAFATLLGAMIEPDRRPEELLGWTETMEAAQTPANRERRRLESLGIDPADARLLAARAAEQAPADLVGYSPVVRAEKLAGVEPRRERDRVRKRAERAAAAESVRERMIRVSHGERTA